MFENFWVVLSCGVFIGNVITVIFLAFLKSGKNEDLFKENIRLRQTIHILIEDISMKKRNSNKENSEYKIAKELS